MHFSLFVQENEEPFHVVNLDCLIKQHLRWISNLPRVKPFYAVKCNNTLGVLRVLSALGAGFDCASKVLIIQYCHCDFPSHFPYLKHVLV